MISHNGPSHRSFERWYWGLWVLLPMAGLFVYPFLWMFLSMFKGNQEIFQPTSLLPDQWDLAHLRRLLAGEWFPFWRVLGLSLFMAVGQALGAVVLTSMTGFAFAKLRFRGRSLLLVACLFTIVLPRQLLVVPLFEWVHSIGLHGSVWGVMFPGMVSGLGVLFFTQVFRQVPDAYLETACLEGVSEWGAYRLLLPMLGSCLLSYGLIHFILAWNEHLIPLVVLGGAEQQTLPLALASLYSSSLRFPYAALMAGSFVAMIPPMVFFLFSYRRFRDALSNVILS